MKKLMALTLALIAVLSLAGCGGKGMHHIIKNKPSVTGIVEEVHNGHVILYSDTAEGYPNGSRWFITLKTSADRAENDKS